MLTHVVERLQIALCCARDQDLLWTNLKHEEFAGFSNIADQACEQPLRAPNMLPLNVERIALDIARNVNQP